MKPKARRRFPLWMKLVSIALALLIPLGIVEVVLRSMSTSDGDGNIFLKGRWLRPRRLRLRTIGAVLSEYEKHPQSYFRYDPTLGWTIRPGARSEDGIFASNSLGIRSAPTEYTPQPTPGKLRIVLLGDSFTHGDQVAFADTWGAQMETLLRAAGVQAEALNLAVSGYGFDQAYLRWKSLGATLSPDIVMLGFCEQDAQRVDSLLWLFWSITPGIVYTKPRFHIENGALVAANLPTVPPERLVDWLRDFPSSGLARYEGAYYAGDYEERFWQSSRLVSYLAEGLRRDGHNSHDRDDLWRAGQEPGAVSAALVEALRADVAAHGAKFIAVNLVWSREMFGLQAGRTLASEQFLKSLAERCPVVRPEGAMLEAAKGGSLDDFYLSGGGHFSPGANAIIARSIADEVLRERKR